MEQLEKRGRGVIEGVVSTQANRAKVIFSEKKKGGGVLFKVKLKKIGGPLMSHLYIFFYHFLLFLQTLLPPTPKPSLPTDTLPHSNNSHHLWNCNQIQRNSNKETFEEMKILSFLTLPLSSKSWPKGFRSPPPSTSRCPTPIHIGSPPSAAGQGLGIIWPLGM